MSTSQAVSIKTKIRQVKIEQFFGQDASVPSQIPVRINKSKQKAQKLANVVNVENVRTPNSSNPVKRRYKLKDPNNWQCIECNQVKRHYAKGMCGPCYRRVFVTPKQAAKRRTAEYMEGRRKKCVECKQVRLIEARGCCKACYQRIFTNPKRAAKRRNADYAKGCEKECVKCLNVKIVNSKNMCQQCYHRVIAEPKHKTKLQNNECAKCKQIKQLVAKQRCSKCYALDLQLSKQQKSSQNSKKTSSTKLKSKLNKTVPSQEYQTIQQNLSTMPAPKNKVIPPMRRPIKPDPEPLVIQSLHRPNLSTCRPSPARISLVQAFRQILAQQNDAEYITLSSGDEDDNY